MKYLRQITLILGFSFLGEILRLLIPLPIPASIYGMLLLFFALSAKIVKVEDVKLTGSFLTSMLPVLFVAPVVSLLDCWADIRSHIWAILLVFILSSITCFAAAGCITQALIRAKEDRKNG